MPDKTHSSNRNPAGSHRLEWRNLLLSDVKVARPDGISEQLLFLFRNAAAFTVQILSNNSNSAFSSMFTHDQYDEKTKTIQLTPKAFNDSRFNSAKHHFDRSYGPGTWDEFILLHEASHALIHDMQETRGPYVEKCDNSSNKANVGLLFNHIPDEATKLVTAFPSSPNDAKKWLVIIRAFEESIADIVSAITVAKTPEQAGQLLKTLSAFRADGSNDGDMVHDSSMAIETARKHLAKNPYPETLGQVFDIAINASSLHAVSKAVASGILTKESQSFLGVDASRLENIKICSSANLSEKLKSRRNQSLEHEHTHAQTSKVAPP